MKDLRPVSRRETTTPETVISVKIEDVHVSQQHNGHGDQKCEANSADTSPSRAFPSGSSSSDGSVELLPPALDQVVEDMDLDVVESDEKGKIIIVSSPGSMDVESGYFESEPLEDYDGNITEALLAREAVPPADVSDSGEDVKPDFMSPYTGPKPASAFEAFLTSESGSTMKTEEDEDEFHSALSVNYPTAQTGSFNKWTSSDDLHLSNLFVSPVETKRPTYYGMTGLNNLGNSCYLSSVVQCLANTRELRDYFLSGTYKLEINRRNTMGTKGRFAAIMEETLRAMWRGDRMSISPSALRDFMAERNDQFSTYGQQDAQEAMTFIIDSLHEDLNRVTVKPYLSDIESDNRPDGEVAEQTWNYYNSRENSAIYDLFSGMFKSTVECLACHKKNIKFDPYQFLSIPVPKYGVVIDCFLYPREPKRRPLGFRMDFNREHSIAYHFPQLQTHLGDIPVANVKILALRNGNFVTVVRPDYECQRLEETVQFHIYEVLTEEIAKEKVHRFLILQYLRVPVMFNAGTTRTCTYCRKMSDIELKRCTRCYSVRYCDSDCQKRDWNYHKTACEVSKGPSIGLPFVISLRAKQLTYEAFYMNVAKAALNSVSYWRAQPGPRTPAKPKENSAEVNGEHSQSTTEADMTSKESSVEEEKACLDDATEEVNLEPATKRILVEWNVAESFKAMTGSSKKNTYPFKLLALDNRGVRSAPIIYPRYNTEMKTAAAVEETIKKSDEFILLWNNSPMDEPLHIDQKEIIYEEDDSCRTVLNERERQRSASQEGVQLEDCISLLTKPEILSQSNAWMCPTCKVHRESSKKFEIWSLPSVLVFQLKRFSKPSGEMFRRDKIETLVDYPLDTLQMSDFLVGPGDGEPYVYDLYGAVVHRGSTWYGHYVSYARCYNVPDTFNSDVPWRFFDDESVEFERDGGRVVNRGAYLLFYRRRGTPSPICLPLRDSDDEEEDDPTAAYEEDVKGRPSNLELSSRRLMSFLSYYCTIL